MSIMPFTGPNRGPGESQADYELRMYALARATQAGMLPGAPSGMPQVNPNFTGVPSQVNAPIMLAPPAAATPAPPPPAFIPPAPAPRRPTTHSAGGTVQQRLAAQRAASEAQYRQQQEHWTEQRPNESNAAYDIRGLISRAFSGEIAPSAFIQNAQRNAEWLWQQPGQLALRGLGALGSGYTAAAETPAGRQAKAQKKQQELDAVRGVAAQMSFLPGQVGERGAAARRGNNPAAFRPESVAPAAAPGGFSPNGFINQFLFPHEGGYNPRDTNGYPVNFGINGKANPGIDIKNLSRDKAAEIAMNKYIIPSGALNMPHAIGAIHADTYYINPTQAAKFLQASGGDPQKYMALRQQWMGNLVATQPEKYGHVAMAWNNRNRDLMQYAGGGGGDMGGNPFGGMTTPPPGFDTYAAYAGQAAGELGAARQAALTPFSMDINRPPMPELPAPEAYVKPDFSAGDAAFAAAAPKDPFSDPNYKKNTLRRGYLQGMAAAMASIQPGQPIGFGELLFRMGAGALGGWTGGQKELQDKADQYDEAMQRYNLALANRDDQKATIEAHNVNAHIQDMNQWRQTTWANGVQQWRKDNDFSIQGSSLITSQSGKDGQVHVNITPIAPMVEAAYHGQLASLFGNIAGPAQAQANFDWRASYEQSIGLAGLAMQQGAGQPKTADEAMIFGTAQMVAPMVRSGAWRNVIPDDIAQKGLTEAYTALGLNPVDQMGQPRPLKQDEQERLDQYMATWLTTLAIHSPELMQKLQRSSSQAGFGGVAGVVDRVMNSRTSTATDSRGRSRTSTTYDSGD